MNLEEWAYRWATTPAEFRIHVWRAHRIDEILSGSSTIGQPEEPTLVLHLFSSTAFRAESALPNLNAERLAHGAWLHPATLRSNADGMLAVGRETNAYVQTFRDGTIEYASSDLLRIPNEAELNYDDFSEWTSSFLGSVHETMSWTREERTYALTLLRMSGHCLPQTPANLGFDRDLILLPVVQTDDPPTARSSLKRLLKEANGTRG